MATHDDPSDPTAAEEAYLAARQAVRTGADVAESDDTPEAQPARTAGQRTFRLPRPGWRRAPVALAATVAAASAAVITFAPAAVVVLLLSVAETGEVAFTSPVRVAVAAWLLAHGVPLQVGSATIGLFPLALSVLVVWRLARAGVHVTRAIGARNTESWRRALVASAATGVAYGMIGLLATAAAAGGGWWAEPFRAAATLGVLGFLAASYGSLRATGVAARWLRRVPLPVRDGVRTGTVAAALVLAAGAAAVGVAVAVSGGAAADTLAAYATGVGGQAGLTLVCLAYAPNLAAWAAAYLLGPGFALGTDTVVRSSEVMVGPLPALPVFAGLPGGPLPALGATLLVVPTVAGTMAGWLLMRRARSRRRRPTWPRLLGPALLAGPVAAALLGLVTQLSTGALGDGQLAVLGPVAWQVAALGAVLVTPGTLLGVAVSGVLVRKRG